MKLSPPSALADTPAVVLRAMFISSPIAPGQRCTFRTGQNPPPRITAAVISFPDTINIRVSKEEWSKQHKGPHGYCVVLTLRYFDLARCVLTTHIVIFVLMSRVTALTTLPLSALALPTLLSHHHLYGPRRDVCLLHPQERRLFRSPLPETCA